MPVHTIATVGDGNSVVWYETSGCISINGKLYFVRDFRYDYAKDLRDAVKNSWHAHILYWSGIREGLWPGPAYCLSVVFHADNRMECRFSIEKWTHMYQRLKFIDTINPQFRRLQRWWRKCARELIARRQERKLAFAMALHSRLGAASCAAGLDADVLRALLMCVK